MMQICAHTVPNDVQEMWEPLEAHLRDVGDASRNFASKFCAGDLGYAMGVLHDLGKAKPEFQAYLRTGRGSVPHAAEGAKAAEKLYGPSLGRLMAYGIAGHHAGLADSDGEHARLSPLKARLKDAETLDPLIDPPGKETLAAAIAAAPELFDALKRPFGRFMAARMLFSCLVDADFLMTEGFYGRFDPAAAVERSWDGNLSMLAEALDERLAAIPSDASSDVAAARRDVLAACRAHANSPPGLFSLTAPTGAGKTLSSLAFALGHARAHGLDRVIYVAPFTAIIDQTAAVYREVLGDPTAVLEHHSAFDWDALRDSNQEEERDGADTLRRAAENWDRPIVVTTAVQFFESLFANRPSRCRKLHNMARSVVILDEAQTLPLKLLRPCLAALDELARTYGSSVVLCTATQPAVRREDGFWPDAEALADVREIVPDPPALHARLRRVTAERLGELDDADLVERLANERQALVIVNNRRHAREMFAALRAASAPDVAVRHLSTAMTAAHRRAVLAEVRALLCRNQPVRVVSTSLVEAGVDIDFPAVYRAMAGLDSISQAAGRCNRSGRLGLDGGRVYVFSPAEGEGRAPPPELQRFAAVAFSVLQRRPDADPLSLDVVREYFSEIYWLSGGQDAARLDDIEIPGQKRGVLAAIGQGWDIPFASIAEAFRMIESDMRPVIIPAQFCANPRWGASKADLHALGMREPAPPPGALARRLQTSLVQVPPRARAALIAGGNAEALRPEIYGEQFVVLTSRDLYDIGTGLDWSDPNYRSFSSNIL